MEYGSHDELMKRQGIYYSLVVAQGSATSAEEPEKPHKLKRCKYPMSNKYSWSKYYDKSLMIFKARTKSVKYEEDYTLAKKTDSDENLPIKKVSSSQVFRDLKAFMKLL